MGSERLIGTCPHCGTKLIARAKVRWWFHWPDKEWSELWRAFDRFFNRIERRHR
jgi:hypothetical protein